MTYFFLGNEPPSPPLPLLSLTTQFFTHINIITVHCIQNNSDYYSGEYEIGFDIEQSLFQCFFFKLFS